MPRRAVLVLGLLAACKPHDTDDTDTTGPGDTDDTDTVVSDGKLRFTILHTNDRHSHFEGFGPEHDYTPTTTGDDATVGGIARVAKLIADLRASHDDQVLLFDAGDWMAGTLYQELRESDASELQLTQELGYDAITLGNHEFDWGPGVLGRIIARGDALGVTTPILSSNVIPNATDAADDDLEALFTSGRIESTHVITLDNGLKIGLFGIIGDDAQRFAPAVVPSSFGETISSTQAAVDALHGEGVDVVVGLTHNGVAEGDSAHSPDEELARAVDGIDVIVGGHSHTALFEALTANGTTIVQAGSFNMYLGELNLAYDPESHELTVEGYTLHAIDDTVGGDAAIEGMVDDFTATLDAGPLVELGHAMHDPIVEVSDTLPYVGCEESGLGNLVADAYVGAMNARDPADPIDFAFQAQGDMRRSLYVGSDGVQEFTDVFGMLPLGFGADDRPGYAMVDFYVTGAELRDACEVTATVAPDYGCSYWIELSSGLRCTMNMDYFPSSRVTTVESWDGANWEAIDIRDSNPTLYHVAVDHYIASLMSIIVDLTDGALSVTPKDIDGNAVDIDDRIFDADPDTAGVQELKMWQAFTDYAATLPDTDGDGIPNVPDSYLVPAGRVVGYEP
jgi:5'-nucleotidase/UDP-sugar diphosphatase